MKEVIRFHLQWSIAFGGGVDIVLIYFVCWPTDLLPPLFEDSSANPASAFQQRRNSWNSPSALLTVRQERELGTIVQDFSGFSKIITKDLSSVVVIQNRSPAALHVLPPGFLKLRLNGETKNVADEYIHTGGWAVIHTYLSKNAAITQ